jgi:hypothetical protein
MTTLFTAASSIAAWTSLLAAAKPNFRPFP